MTAQKIVPNLWFAAEAETAANFYVSLLANSRLTDVSRYDQAAAEATGQPEGSVLTVAFELAGQRFLAINGGPEFQITPAISFMIYCETEAEIDDLYARLGAGGAVLMPLQEYDFADKYAWLQDRFGVSWQLFLGAPRQDKIAVSLLFVGEQCGQAEAAIQLYTALFPNSRVESLSRYGANDQGEIEGTVQHATFWLDGQEFMAMDSNLAHPFTFNEAVSLLVDCQDQTEVDFYWERLSDGGAEGRCGWLKDRFGVSWQIVPAVLSELMQSEDAAAAGRAVQAMLQMKKLDTAALQRAFAG